MRGFVQLHMLTEYVDALAKFFVKPILHGIWMSTGASLISGSNKWQYAICCNTTH